MKYFYIMIRGELHVAQTTDWKTLTFYLGNDLKWWEIPLATYRSDAKIPGVRQIIIK